MPRTHRLQGFLLGTAVALAAAAGAFRPFDTPMYGYFLDANEWAARGRIADTFTPLAYPLFIGPAYRLGGTSGIVALQALLYVGIVWLAGKLLLRMGVSATWAVAGGVLIAIDPEYLLSVPKVWDVNLSVFLLLVFIWSCVVLRERGAGPGTSIMLGTAAGAGMFCRPNYILMAPVVAYGLYHSRARTPRRIALSGALIAVVASGVFALLGLLSHGSLFLPRNGPYNLFAGHNRYAAETLLSKLNAEPSLPIALAEVYPGRMPDSSAPGFYYSRELEPIYTRASIEFAKGHPVEEVRLLLIKLFTLFRPDTKVHPLLSREGLAKLLLTLPAPVLLVLLIGTRKAGLDELDRLLLIAYVSYVLPFLVTNSDPRFRTPLDALLLIHCVRRIYVVRASGTAKTEAL